MSLSDEDLDRIEKTAQAGYAEFDPTMIAALVAEVRRLRTIVPCESCKGVGMIAYGPPPGSTYAERSCQDCDGLNMEEGRDVLVYETARGVLEPIGDRATSAPADTGTGRWEFDGAVWSIDLGEDNERAYIFPPVAADE